MKTFLYILRKYLKMMSKSITFLTVSCRTSATLRSITFPVKKMQFGEVHKCERQILINTVVYEDFLSHFLQNVKIWGQIHWLLQCFAMWFRSAPNHCFFLGKTWFLEGHKSRFRCLVAGLRGPAGRLSSHLGHSFFLPFHFSAGKKKVPSKAQCFGARHFLNL